MPLVHNTVLVPNTVLVHNTVLTHQWGILLLVLLQVLAQVQA